MKVLAINGSPRMDKGTTAVILNPFLEGLEDAGATTSLYYTSKMSIKPCRGCFACSINGTGICWQQDDVTGIYSEVAGADVWIFATPVYISGPTGPLKMFIDRLLIPLGKPSLSLVEGHCHHAMRDEVKHGQVILVSSCAYWELDNFDLLVSQLQALCGHAERQFAAQLLRPHAPALAAMLGKSEQADDAVRAAKEAGMCFAENGVIPRTVLDRISQPLLPLEAYIGVGGGEAD